MRLSSFIIGLIFIGFIVTSISLVMLEVSQNYGKAYDNTSLGVYDELNELSALSDELDNRSDEIKDNPNILDKIGYYVTQGVNVIKTGKQSVDTFDSMSNAAIEHANLGPGGKYLRVAVSSALIIMVVLGVVISALLKWWV